MVGVFFIFGLTEIKKHQRIRLFKQIRLGF